MTWFMKRKREMTPELAARQLRAQALEALARAPGGAIMEMAFPGALATLVCLPDGSTSLYLSSGGGVIGAGAHDSVRVAAETFRRVAAAGGGEFDAHAGDWPLAVGYVRFFRRGAPDLHGVSVEEAVLRLGKHPLSPLYAAGQAVITAIRETTPPA